MIVTNEALSPKPGVEIRFQQPSASGNSAVATDREGIASSNLLCRDV